MKKKKIIIMGAGFAGLRSFYHLKEYDKYFDITLIDKRVFSLEKPALPEVAFNGNKVEHTLIDLKHVIEHHDGHFLQDEVVKINPKLNHIHLKSGAKISYDYLMITTGAYKDFNAIKGFEQYGYSMCDDKHAVKLWERLKNFKGGHVVIGASKSNFGHRVDAPDLKAPCEGPIGEAMFMTEYYLRKKGFRDKSTVDVFTPGGIFFEDVGDLVRNKVGGVMQERGINLHMNKVLKEITATEMIFEDGSRMPSDLSIIIPPYKAHCIFKESGLGDDKGFIPTDKTMRHLDYVNIFAAGDINALAQPKLGHIAVHQADVATSTLIKEVTGEGDIIPFKPEVFCIMNMGGMDATLIYSDVLYDGPHDIAIHSSMARMMKWGFDNYYFHTRGHMPPTFSVKALEKLLEFFQEDEQ